MQRSPFGSAAAWADVFSSLQLHPKNYANAEEISLQTRQLGNSDMHFTAIGFGAWAIGGGDWQFSWGPQDDNDSIAAIQRALDLGINWIDTAAIYGLGHSEEVVARALEGRTKKPFVFTKCSMVWHKKLLGKGSSYQPQFETGLPPQGTGSQPAPLAHGCDRSLSDPLARSRSGH